MAVADYPTETGHGHPSLRTQIMFIIVIPTALCLTGVPVRQTQKISVDNAVKSHRNGPIAIVLISRYHHELMTKFNIRVGQEFKWNYDPPIWAGVFLGSSDEVPHIDEFTDQMSSYNKSEIELITLVGGHRFFDLVAAIDFERITLFDKNINEFTKFSIVLDILSDTSHEDFDDFRELHEYIHQNPDDFYLPQELADKATIQPKSDFRNEWDGKEYSMYTLSPPTKYPQYRWSPSEREYNSVSSALRSDLNDDVFLGLPEIDAEGRLVIVYLSGLTHIDWNFEKSIENASRIVPIYANYFEPHSTSDGPTSNRYLNLVAKGGAYLRRGEVQPIINFLQKRKPPIRTGLKHIAQGEFKRAIEMLRSPNRSDPNAHILNPHLYWEDLVFRYAEQPVVQIWPPEDQSAVGGAFDQPFDRGMEVTDFLSEGHNNRWASCVFHILLGKNERDSDEARLALFTEALAQAERNRIERIIVTEHNKASGQFQEQTSVRENVELKEIVLSHIGSSYELVATRDMPGDGAPDRNTMIVLDRKSDT
jgi:hypothetical protein